MSKTVDHMASLGAITPDIKNDKPRMIKRVGERDKMRGLSSILSLFRNVFNKLINYIGARMLRTIYHMTLELLRNRVFDVKTSRFSVYNGLH